MGSAYPIEPMGEEAAGRFHDARIRLAFYVGVPALTALLFGLNQTGMSRLLPNGWAVPYWLGITLPLWALLDLCSRGVNRLFQRAKPHRWLVLLGGALAAMALFSPYIAAYTDLVAGRLLNGQAYRVQPPFPEAFLDLRRFVAYSGVPIYWIAIALFFARHFRFPPYLVRDEAAAAPAARPPQTEAPPEPARNAFGLPERSGLMALTPYHLGSDIVSLQAEDHYVRVVTERGNALVRYRFSDALNEVRSMPGIQVHRSHWVAVGAVERVRSDAKGHRLVLKDGTEVPVSRSNIGVLRAAGLC